MLGAQLQESELPDKLRVGEAMELYSSFYRDPADWRELIGMVTLAIANRPDAEPSVNAQIAKVPHHLVNLPMMDISSTEVRRRVAAGESIATLVPPAVASYIERRQLYR